MSYFKKFQNTINKKSAPYPNINDHMEKIY